MIRKQLNCKNRSKHLSKALTKEDGWWHMSEHTRRHYESLVIRKVQIKSTMRHHRTSIKWLKVKRLTTKCYETGSSSHLPPWSTARRRLHGTDQEGWKYLSTLTPEQIVPAALFVTAPNREQPPMSINRGADKQIGVYPAIRGTSSQP